VVKKYKTMEKLNFQKIIEELISPLNPKEKEVILRRFGLEKKERETLEAIGKDFGICRERVRQIQNKAFEKMKERLKDYKEILEKAKVLLEKAGGVKKEEDFLFEIGGEEYQNHFYFMLKLDGSLFRFPGNDQFFACWAVDEKTFKEHQSFIKKLIKKLEEIKKPVKLDEILEFFPMKKEILEAKIKTSKLIGKNEDGLYGLKEWPEINPRGIRDKIFIALKKIGKPLHFKEIAVVISHPNDHTVHNELIKDPRFVLVGRGIYALREWGYFPGEVKDVILKTLQRAGRPMTKEEIINEVTRQRLVKKSTILMNLSNRRLFKRDENGRYFPVQEI